MLTDFGSARIVRGLLCERACDGLDDPTVRSAPTEVIVERLQNVLFGTTTGFHRRGGDDHAVEAVPALTCLFIENGKLKGMRLFSGSETFDGGDRMVSHGLGGQLT
jgi:hypothetical protein